MTSTIEERRVPSAPSAVEVRSVRRRASQVRPAAILVAILVGGLACWELISRLELIDPDFISRPSAIAAAYPELAESARVRSALATTGKTMGMAFLYGTGIGLILGYLLGASRLMRGAFFGPSLFLLSVPKSIFIPLFMVFFGINTTTAIYYGAFSSFIYVLVNVVGGFDLIESKHLLVARAYAANPLHRIADVILPASLPGVFTGVWYGLKGSLQGVLIFELFVSVGGLGQIIRFYTNGLRVDMVFGLILGISFVAILTGSAWSWVERRLSRWRPSDLGVVAQNNYVA